MTGTGTQTDPYVVDNWADFVTVIGNPGYVKVAENQVWDMNDIAPEGVAYLPGIRATEIDGNGLVIRNLYLTGTNGIINNSATMLKNIKFLDVRTSTNTRGLFYVNYAMDFDRVTVTGIIEGMSFVYNSSRTPQFTRCFINLNLVGGAKFSYGTAPYPLIFKHTRIKFDGVSSVESGYFRMEDSWLFGKNPFTKLTFEKLTDSVIDLEIDVDISTNTVLSTLINTDKVDPSATIPDVFIPATTAQLADAEYLSSKGFPIGVN